MRPRTVVERMPRLAALSHAVPPHVLPQSEAMERVRRLLLPGDILQRILSVYENAGVQTRYIARPPEWYLQPHGWKSRTEAFLQVGVDLAEEAARRCLEKASVEPGEIDGVVFVTSTGIATPSLEARLANRMGLPSRVLRLPLWGLGCAGGVAGLARGADLATARPDGRFLVVALELCSLAFQKERLDKKLLVATSLFGDGCAAALLEGDAVADPGDPSWVSSASHQWRETEYVMGWDVADEGLDVVFDPLIPQFVAQNVRPPVHAFVGERRVGAYALHPGGPKVIDAFAQAMELADGELQASRDVLRDFGNMSSPTALFVLERVLAQKPAAPVLAAALGPGFATELALLQGAPAS